MMTFEFKFYFKIFKNFKKFSLLYSDALTNSLTAQNQCKNLPGL